MKKIMMVVAAIAVSFAMGFCTQAQEKTAETPAINGVSPQQADRQSSPSDEVLVPGQVESVAPVSPLESGTMETPEAVNRTVGCSGCMNANSPTVGGCTNVCAFAACGCSTCRTRQCRSNRCTTTSCVVNVCGCNNVSISSTADSQPSPSFGCGCGSGINQISYAQELDDTTVSAVDIAMPVSVASCDQCTPVRTRGIRGLIFRNR